MIGWHVTSAKKLARYLSAGAILPPVRAWTNVGAAERFSKQTGRRIVLRLKLDASFTQLEGHCGEARVSMNPYRLRDF